MDVCGRYAVTIVVVVAQPAPRVLTLSGEMEPRTLRAPPIFTRSLLPFLTEEAGTVGGKPLSVAELIDPLTALGCVTNILTECFAERRFGFDGVKARALRRSAR